MNKYNKVRGWQTSVIWILFVSQGDVWNKPVSLMIKLSHADFSELKQVILFNLCSILEGQKGKENEADKLRSIQQAE